MFEFFGGIFLWSWALMVTWPFMLVFVLLTIWICADDDPGVFGFIATIVVSAVTINYFEISWETYRWYLYTYVPIGFLWSFIRFDFYAKAIVKESHEYHENNKAERIEFQKRHLNIWRNSTRISYWVTAWPVSLISSGLRDAVEAVRKFVITVARKFYERIARRYIES